MSPSHRASFFFESLLGRHERVAGNLRVRTVLPGWHKKLLWRDSEPVALTPKVLDTLLTLIELRDRVVTKDELLERVWRGTVVEEGGLARNISILRKALGEKPDQHTYIVTVPGKGYRFVADVREAAGAGASAKEARASRWLLLGGLVALAAAVLVVYLLRHPPGAPAAPPRLLRSQYCRWPICQATRRRNISPMDDGGAHRQPCAYPRASRCLAHVSDAIQRRHPLSS
jgi:DNA-binding winged helix-turn-helix (wHTH) protein